MPERKLIIGILSITVLLAVVGISISLIFAEQPVLPILQRDITSPPTAVDYATANDYINLNTAFDSKGNIHLLWMAGRDSNFVYQRSSDMGNSWSRPQALAYNEPALSKYRMLASYGDHPKIIAVGNMLTALWTFDGEPEMYNHGNGQTGWNTNGGFIVRTSSDYGDTWGPEQKAFLGNVVLDNYYAVLGDTIYIVYGGEEYDNYSTFFSKSADFGLHWDKPVRIGPDLNRPGRVISITISGQTIHVIGKAEDETDSKGVGSTGFWHIRGRNLGQSWEEPKRFSFGQRDGIGASIGSLTIMPYGDDLLLTLATNDIDYLLSQDDGVSWSRPSMLGATTLFGNHNACIVGDKAADIFWIDYRNQKMDWESRMPDPISAMLLWDRSPNWANNDLYFARLENGHIREKIRLTPPMSYVSDISCGQVSGHTIVIWSGKREVGKSVEDSPAPFEIFYRILSPHTSGIG
jgi:hypothetical protein